MFSDTPIGLPELDELGRATFVRRLLRPLVEWAGPEGLVVGLYGSWGEGKSSILNLLDFEITAWEGGSAPRRAITVRFNPWIYPNPESLILAFFGTLAERIGAAPYLSDRERIQLTSALRGIGRFSAPLLLATGNPIAAVIAPAVTATASHLLKRGEADLHGHKKAAAEGLTKLSRQRLPVRVVVLIDDLDRADAPEIRAALKLIKLIADLPNITYLLAMDPQKVSEALQGRRNDGEVADDTPGRPAEFLEKIIQVPIRLPVIDLAQLERLIGEGVEGVLRDAGTNRVDATARNRKGEPDRSYLPLILRRVRTLRDRARLLNNLRFMLLSGEQALEVHPTDAVLVSYLHTFFPALYDRVRRNKLLLTSSFSLERRLASKVGQSFEQGRANAIFAVATGKKSEQAPQRRRRHVIEDLRAADMEDDDEAAYDLILALFPDAASGEEIPEERYREWRRHHRIQLEENFDRYFSLEPPTTEVSTEFIGEYVSELLQWANSEGPAGAAHESLAAPFPSIPSESHESLVTKLSDQLSLSLASDELENNTAATAGARIIAGLETRLQFPELLRLARAVARESGRRTDAGERGARLVQLAVNGLQNDIFAMLLAAGFRDSGSYPYRFPPEMAVEIAKLGTARMRKYLASGANLFSDYDYEDSTHIMWRWRELLLVTEEGLSDARDYYRGLIENDPARLPVYLSLFAHGTGENMDIPKIKGSVAPTELKKMVEDFYDLPELISRCETFLAQDPPSDDPYGLVQQFIDVAPAAPAS